MGLFSSYLLFSDIFPPPDHRPRVLIGPSVNRVQINQPTNQNITQHKTQRGPSAREGDGTPYPTITPRQHNNTQQPGIAKNATVNARHNSLREPELDLVLRRVGGVGTVAHVAPHPAQKESIARQAGRQAGRERASMFRYSTPYSMQGRPKRCHSRPKSGNNPRKNRDSAGKIMEQKRLPPLRICGQGNSTTDDKKKKTLDF